MAIEQPKIGIGPEGRPAALIRFIAATILAIVVFVYGFSPATIVMVFLPASLMMLVALGHLALMGDGFPLAPPGGNWNPTKSRVTAAVGMTAIFAVFTALFLAFMLYLFPKWPMSPCISGGGQ